MRTLHSPTLTANPPRKGKPLVLFLIALASVLMCFEAAAEEESIAAVLKAREMNFLFRNATPSYPCHELRNRIANILRAVGARDDVKVDVRNCDNFSQFEDSPFDRTDEFGRPSDRFGARRNTRDQMINVRLELMAPVPVTPEVLAEMDKDKSRRELISKVTGNPMVAMNDPIVFAAKRQQVTLSRRTVRLEPEDCELLDQMASSVFRELNVRVVRGNFICDRFNRSNLPPQVTVEALLPVAMAQPLPGAGDPATNTPAPAEKSESTPAVTSEIQILP
jgi:hypothetical protein